MVRKKSIVARCMKLIWPFRRKPVKLAPGELERLKEAAAGSKLLGRQDKRIIASKALAAFLAATIAFGTPYGLVRKHQLEVRAKQETVQREQEQKHLNRIQALKKAGVADVKTWAEAMKKNEEMQTKFPAVEPLTPDDFAQIERMFKEVKTSHGPQYLNIVLPSLKAVRHWAKGKQDFEAERKALWEAFHYTTVDWDLLMLPEAYSLMEYVAKNNHKPEFRKLLLKLSKYAKFEVYPFETPY